MAFRSSARPLVPAWIRASALAAALGAIASPAAAGGPATIRFEQQTSQVVEGARSVSTRLLLQTPDAQPLPAPAWVTYGTRDVTARENHDYIGIVRTVPLPAGTPSGTAVPVTVELRDDDIDEHDEVFEIKLLQVSGSVIAGFWDTHFVTIVDEDPPPAVSFEYMPLGSEGECTWTQMSFSLKLSRRSERGVTVTYETSDGTATAPEDYLSRSGSVTFPPDQDWQRVDVSIRDDNTTEPDETLRLTLTAATFAALPAPVGTGTIQANDQNPLPAVSRQLGHGTSFTGSLGPADGTVGQDEYAFAPDPMTSFEIVVEGTGRVAPPRLDGSCAALTPLGSRPYGVGHITVMRGQFLYPPPFTIETARIRVGAFDCIADCTDDDVYRIRAFDTTYTTGRVVTSASQSVVLIVQNVTDEKLSGHVWVWSPSGQVVGNLWLDLGSRQTSAVNLGPYVTGDTALLSITHDGPYGALAGKMVVLDPATGAVSESPLAPRPY